MAIWLNESDVRASLSHEALLADIENALVAFSAARVTQPLRTVIECAPRSFFASMPVRMSDAPGLGAKLVTVFPGNADRSKATHLASIVLLDPSSGELLAIVDGRYITEVRTAAASALSVRHLARPNTPILAILGSGVQARSHLQFLRLMRRFEEVRCWSPNRERLLVFAQESPGVRACASAKEAASEADVIVLATSSSTPAIRSDCVKCGAHIISIGACRPYEREVDPALTARARLIVDSRESALRESGDVVMGIREGWFNEAHIAGELGAVISGVLVGRMSKDEVTLFKSLGLAVEDLSAAMLVYREALSNGLGLRLT